MGKNVPTDVTVNVYHEKNLNSFHERVELEKRWHDFNIRAVWRDPTTLANDIKHSGWLKSDSIGFITRYDHVSQAVKAYLTEMTGKMTHKISKGRGVEMTLFELVPKSFESKTSARFWFALGSGTDAQDTALNEIILWDFGWAMNRSRKKKTYMNVGVWVEPLPNR